MSYENTAGIAVSNQYNARNTGNTVGEQRTIDSEHRLTLEITGETLNSPFLPPYVVPAGARFLQAYLRVDQAFVLGGTSPTVTIGDAVAGPGVNGITLTQAELQAVGTKVPASTGNGTWAFNSATGTTANAKVGIAMGGTTPTSTNAGKATLVITYIYNNRT